MARSCILRLYHSHAPALECTRDAQALRNAEALQDEYPRRRVGTMQELMGPDSNNSEY